MKILDNLKKVLEPNVLAISIVGNISTMTLDKFLWALCVHEMHILWWFKKYLYLLALQTNQLEPS